VGLVLDVEHRAFGVPHAREEQLGVATDELRTAGDVRIDPLEAAVIEGDDVDLGGQVARL